MGDYIMDMRKRVGHIPLMQCGASVIVENERGEILLQQRSDSGAWGYPGGAVELYERGANFLRKRACMLERWNCWACFRDRRWPIPIPMAIR
jgi:8-oxo-dGTP pyrophosphatase MutT (NUDIX family)